MTKDLTHGNPARQILLFTIPLLLGNIFQQFYNMADTLIVGRTLGVNALAAVGCTGSLMFFILGFAQGLTSGFSIVTSQRFGARDEAGVRRSFAASILLSVCITVLLTLLGAVFARPLLLLLRTPADILEEAYRYTVVIFCGIAASVLFNLLSNVLRALGDSRTPLLFLTVACALNIGLDFLLILVIPMGVAGAAAATVAAQLLSGLACVVFIAKRFPQLHLRREDWRLSRGELWEHLRLGLPMGFQSSIIAIGAIVLQFALNGLGSQTVAAYTAAQKVDSLATQPIMSFGMTMATYAGQNYGAGNVERIKRGVRQCVAMSVSFSVAVGLLCIFFGRNLVWLFLGDGSQAVVDQAQTYLVINGATYFILSLLFDFRFTLQGLGQSFVPTIAGVMELIMRSFAALFLGNAFGFTGVCTANPLAWLGALIPLTIAMVLTMRRLTWDHPPAAE